MKHAIEEALRMKYEALNDTISYAMTSNMNDDTDGEFIALRHALEVLLDITERFVPNDDRQSARGAIDPIGETAGEDDGGTPDKSHELVMIIPKDLPENSKHGVNGHNPKAGARPTKFRIYGLDAGGVADGYVDVGTAAELAGRNNIGPSTIYRLAGKEPKEGSRWLVEKVVE